MDDGLDLLIVYHDLFDGYHKKRDNCNHDHLSTVRTGMCDCLLYVHPCMCVTIKTCKQVKSITRPFACTTVAAALCTGVAAAPPPGHLPIMGWSSWNSFKFHINETLVKTSAGECTPL